MFEEPPHKLQGRYSEPKRVHSGRYEVTVENRGMCKAQHLANNVGDGLNDVLSNPEFSFQGFGGILENLGEQRGSVIRFVSLECVTQCFFYGDSLTGNILIYIHDAIPFCCCS